MHTVKLKIESGIQYPVLTPELRVAVARKMKVGDSVFFKEKKTAHSFANTVHWVTRGTLFRQSVIKVKGGYRVWKLRRPKALPKKKKGHA